jgi:hypothetical protein
VLYLQCIFFNGMGKETKASKKMSKKVKTQNLVMHILLESEFLRKMYRAKGKLEMLKVDFTLDKESLSSVNISTNT